MLPTLGKRQVSAWACALLGQTSRCSSSELNRALAVIGAVLGRRRKRKTPAAPSELLQQLSIRLTLVPPAAGARKERRTLLLFRARRTVSRQLSAPHSPRVNATWCAEQAAVRC